MESIEGGSFFANRITIKKKEKSRRGERTKAKGGEKGQPPDIGWERGREEGITKRREEELREQQPPARGGGI